MLGAMTKSLCSKPKHRVPEPLSVNSSTPRQKWLRLASFNEVMTFMESQEERGCVIR